MKRFRVAILILVAIVTHLVEIALFAIGIAILLETGMHGQLGGAYEAGFIDDFYYSAIVYTAVGFGDITPTGAMRFYTAIEAITGLVLIAWTASAIFLAMQRFWQLKRESSDQG